MKTFAQCAMAVLLCSPASAQLAQRVSAVRDGAVTFMFAPRAGVCGDGLHYIRVGRSFMGTLTWAGDRTPCELGPVQVKITKVAGEIDRLESWVGNPRSRDARDLGMVSSSEAAAYLLQIARTSNNSASTRAILPAVLADSAKPWPQLLIIARDTTTRSHSTRQDALMWLARFATAQLAGHSNELLDDDNDRSDSENLKSHAVFVMSQLPRSEAVPALIDVARSNRDVTVRGHALFWLSQSGDPRAVEVIASLLR